MLKHGIYEQEINNETRSDVEGTMVRECFDCANYLWKRGFR